MALNAQPGVAALQNWYSPNFGLYKVDSDSLNIPGVIAQAAKDLGFNTDWYPYSLRWWDSANATGTLIDYMLITGDRSYLPVLDTTFNNAQSAYTVIVDAQINIPVVKIPFVGTVGGGSVPTKFHKLTYTNFLNGYYDDEGWWALTWIKAYDLTLDQKYLDMAVTIFQDMAGGWDTTFAGGGIWWSKAPPHKSDSGQVPYKNAIANELFMAVAARLYLRKAGGAPVFPGTNDASYKTWAVNEATWFINSRLIRDAGSHGPGGLNLVNDSLNTSGENDGTTTFWTYNHGVILRAFCDLSTITGDPGYRLRAVLIANAAINYFSDSNKILTEVNFNPTSNGPDTCQFKGVFIRNLASLFASNNDPNYTACTFIANNANSVLAHGNSSSQFGGTWDSSPPDSVDFIRQAAGIDAINAANRVLLAEAPISLKNTLALVRQKLPAGIRDVIGGVTSSVRGWAVAVAT